ncbi:OmpL47-type beta-barrel domain-containing protein [Methanocella arvoryzae]|uniref:FlgD/Vpr Ig-like domain-containing protein n=1 Tax=Methanocella arvoryzae (strain DSM 22066 / NBRC 105507 / MRE50) TaxID=351160 RepID=Q0W539_METAR|nr:6-bladed beta-propeller [Methanocella arvoryzae]CAJ36504.1 hypothetical protein RCIX1195 [Methanocella arvoryzae MRE50]
MPGKRVFCLMAMIAILVTYAIAPALAASLSLAAPASPGAIKTGSVTNVSYTLSNMINGNVEVIVNGAGGATVWSAYLPMQAAGIHNVTWNGAYANGTPVPDGFYAITLAASNGTLGSRGNGNYQFNGPFDVEVGVDGKIYVADHGNNRVQVYSDTGAYLLTVGSGPGSGDSQFDRPMSVAVDSAGSIYVADYMNNKVKIFDGAGTYLRSIGTGTLGTGDYEFRRPKGVTVDGSGNVYVVDGYNNRIQVFDSAGTYLRTIGASGFGPSGTTHFFVPKDCKVGADGTVYVADEGGMCVHVFSNTGAWIRTIGTPGTSGSGNYQFNCPCDVAVDGGGNIYVADPGNDKVKIYDNTGTYLRSIGTGIGGAGDDQFDDPMSVDLDSEGNIYVADRNNNRIRIFYQSATAVTGVLVDNTAPVVTCSPDSPASGWFVADVPVTLAAADNPGGSGMESLKYSLDNVHWNPYTGGFTLTTEGANMVYWNATDIPGNSALGSRSLNIDRIAPTTTATLSGNTQNGAYTSRVTITLSAVDATSGVEYTEYKVNNGSWARYSGLLTLDSTSTVNYRSSDFAGNLEAEKTISFTRIYLPPGTVSMDEMYGRPGATPSPSPTPTVTPAPTATVTATAAPTISQSPVANPTATPEETPQNSGYLLWLTFGLVAVIVLVAGGYVLFFRK